MQRLSVAGHMGRAAQKMLLDIVQAQDPALSAVLHDSQAEVKPYIVSGLLTRDAVPLIGAVPTEESAWVRIGGLNQSVNAVLLHFAANPPPEIEFDRERWRIESIATTRDQHVWANSASFADLLRRNPHEHAPDSVRFQFAAPTGFHSKSLNVPLPIPALVFGSLYARWNTLAPVQLPDLLPDFVDQFVPISRYQTRTEILRFKQGGQQIGFVGEVGYSILARNAGLAKHDAGLAAALEAQHSDLSAAIGLLADFAFYSGVGIKTTTGMGMMRRLYRMDSLAEF
jgi:CRISPR-associated endoribonuclease Cas6